MSSPRPQCQCLGCQQLFLPSKFARGRQRFCATTACRQASKTHAQRQWRQKPENRDYFRGPTQVERVRQWRQRHPGYSRGRRAGPAAPPLQDLAPTPGPAPQGVAPGEVSPAPPVPAPGGAALQDLALGQHPLLVGLISLLTGEALQDKVAAVARRLVEQGERVLGQERKTAGPAAVFA